MVADLAAQGMSLDDLVGAESILGRFFRVGSGSVLDFIGETILDYEGLRSALDDLDSTPGNVTFTESALMFIG